jgi:hypothetical protein
MMMLSDALLFVRSTYRGADQRHRVCGDSLEEIA